MDAFRHQLAREYNPVGIAETVVVNDLARRAAKLEVIEASVCALRQQAASSLAKVTGPLNVTESGSGDAMLAGAMSSGQIENLERHSLSNARAFYRGMVALSMLQASRRAEESADLGSSDPRFMSERACMTYLVRRWHDGDQPCHGCGHTATGSWIESHRCWECRNCGKQAGIRTGTVMERSPLPLTAWFAAIRLMLIRPSIVTTELAAKICVNRVPTVRSMAGKIRRAIANENASQLLAGLDMLYCNTT